MKSMMYRVVLLWIAILSVAIVAAIWLNNESKFKALENQSQWIERQVLMMSVQVNQMNWKDETIHHDNLTQLLQIPTVLSVRLGESLHLEKFQTNRSVETNVFQFQLEIPNHANRLNIHLNPNNSKFFDSSFEILSLLIIGLLALGGLFTRKIFSPLLQLDNKAEAILSGDFEPEHYPLINDHPSTSELAINLLLNEYHCSKVQQAELSNRLRRHSFLDEVTGLGNREYFDAELEINLNTADESIHGTVILFSFEPLVDEYFENRGNFDQLMKQLGEFFHRVVSEHELCWVARRDKVDFSMLILEQSPDKVRRICLRIIRDLDRSIFDSTTFKHHFVNVGASFFSAGDHAYQVLAMADMALRHAQLEGENRYHLYHSENLSKDHVKGSVRWRTFLQNTLDKRNILLYFQEIMSFNQDDVVHYEVLARINELGKTIPASVFIPMASRFGMAAKFDRLVIDMLLNDISIIHLDEHMKLTINLFPDSLLDEEFVDWLEGQLKCRPALAPRITFELKEYAVNERAEDLQEPMLRLFALGCRWCIENVGSPNADLAYIKSLPIHSLKLSQAIVRNIDRFKEKTLFVRSLVAMAHHENISTWGEGVESELEWMMLKSLGVNGGQGYYLDYPKQQDVSNVIPLKKAL